LRSLSGFAGEFSQTRYDVFEQARTMPDISDPLHLPGGARLPNRLAKAAITEGLADERGWPTAGLERLYQGWSDAGFGLLISGNIVVDGDHLERPGNIIIDRECAVQARALRKWTAVATQGGAHFWAQLSHSGRQTPKTVNPHPLSVSELKMGLPGGLFGKPRAMTPGELHLLVEKFATAATVCKAVGFTGVQIHAAHGYLLGSFLTPKANNRRDRWGGSLENRARILLDVVSAVRKRVGRQFPIAVKLNSADFQRGGFDEKDSLTVGRWLEAAGVDLLEISGGTYESPVMLGASGISADCERPPRKASTAAREAYFFDFARAMRQELRMPIMLTGGFRSRAGMKAALDEGVDLLGLARPVCVDQSCVKALLSGEVDRLDSWEESIKREKGLFSSNSPIPLIGMLTNFAAIYWFYAQVYRLAKGKPANVKLWPPRAMVEVITTENSILGRRRRWLQKAGASVAAPLDETPARTANKRAA
jgi:2,4-dienoyl-CoA reductase-like NADH-dependent reductase (Old Yellow Enzyme family)